MGKKTKITYAYQCTQVYSLRGGTPTYGIVYYTNGAKLQTVFNEKYYGIQPFYFNRYYNKNSAIGVNEAIGLSGFESQKDPKNIYMISIGESDTTSNSFYKLNNNFLKGQDNLSGVVFGNNVIIQHIGDNAFNHCSRLMAFNSQNTNGMLRIGQIYGSSFKDCNQLTTAFFCKLQFTPRANTKHLSIGHEAFAGCTQLDLSQILTTEYAQSKIILYGDGQFANTATTEIPDCLAAGLPARAFQNCSKLKIAKLPEGTSGVGAQAFIGCTNLEEIDLSTCDQKYFHGFDTACFEGCGLLSRFKDDREEKLVIQEDGIIQFNFQNCATSRLFYNCKGLTGTVILSDKCEHVGFEAFRGTNIEKIVIPASVKTIDYDAFADCPCLQEIIFIKGRDSDNLLSIGQGAFYNSGTDIKVQELKICYANSIDEAKKNFLIKEPQKLDFIKTLGKGCFAKSGLKSFNMDLDKVIYVGGLLFQDCKKLESVKFFESGARNWVANSGNYNNTENHMSPNEKITLSKQPQYLPNKALFPGCSGLTTYQGPIEFLLGHNIENNTVNTVWEEAKKLSYIILTIPQQANLEDNTNNNVITLENSDIREFLTLHFLEKLTEIYIPNSVTFIPGKMCSSGSISNKFQSLNGLVAYDNNDDFYQKKIIDNFSGSDYVSKDYKNFIDSNPWEDIERTVKQKYFYIANNVNFFSKDNEQNQTFYTLSNHFYRTHVRLGSNNNINFLIKGSIFSNEIAQVQNLYYMGQELPYGGGGNFNFASVPFINITNLFLSKDIQVIPQHCFSKCEALKNIYQDYDTAKQHSFDNLRYIHTNSFTIPDTIPETTTPFKLYK